MNKNKNPKKIIFKIKINNKSLELNSNLIKPMVSINKTV